MVGLARTALGQAEGLPARISASKGMVPSLIQQALLWTLPNTGVLGGSFLEVRLGSLSPALEAIPQGAFPK